MKEENKKDEAQINIELKEDMALGKYSNLAIVTHSPSEFVLDFINVMPNMPHAPVVSRIILTPDHARNLLNALENNISKYEESFGEISGIYLDKELEFPINYAGPTAEA